MTYEIFRNQIGTFTTPISLGILREQEMTTERIMDDLGYKLDELPILSDVAVRESVTLPDRSNQVVDVALAIIDPDPGGYDPYNNAPPVPIEKLRQRWPD